MEIRLILTKKSFKFIFPSETSEPNLAKLCRDDLHGVKIISESPDLHSRWMHY